MRLILSLIICSLLISCESHSQKANDDLLERELANQDRAKYGNKTPHIQVITDSAELANIRFYIERNERNKQQADKKQLANRSIAQLYKAGDKSVVPKIISTLQTGSTDAKRELIDQLKRRFDDGDNYTITEPEIINLILLSIEDTALETTVVQTAGITELKGYVPVFEKRLTSGKSTAEMRIAYWLSSDSANKTALNYISQCIAASKLEENSLDNLLSYLVNYGAKGDAATKAYVGNLAMMAYNKKLVSKQEFDELKNFAYSSGNAAEALLQCLFQYGDARVIPIAKEMLAKNIRVQSAVRALIRLEGAKHLDKITLRLRSKENFFDGLDIVEALDKKYRTDQLLKEVLVQFAKQNDIQNYQIERMVRSYKAMQADSYIENIASIISNKTLIAKFQKAYALYHFSPDAVLNDLVQYGILPSKPAAIPVGPDESADSYMYKILDAQKRYLSFDTEPSIVPVDYDSLLVNFTRYCDGALNNMRVVQIAENNGDDTFKYNVFALFNNRAFKMQPPDMGDWYDVMSLNAMLDKVLEHAGVNKRFVLIETGDQTVQYIYGEPAKVSALLKKYVL